MKNKPLLRIRVDEAAITTRARKAVENLVAAGHDPIDIARLTDTTLVSLLDGASPRIGRPQWMALHRHYGISLLWLWTGLGPEKTPELPPDLQFITSTR